MLHPDPLRNGEVVQKWIDYLKPYNERPDMMLAPDSLFFQHQLVHHILTKTAVNGNVVELDFSAVDELPLPIGQQELTMKIVTAVPARFGSADIRIRLQELQKEKEYIYILKLTRKRGRRKVSIMVK